jgi:hypothetical protein
MTAPREKQKPWGCFYLNDKPEIAEDELCIEEFNQYCLLVADK